MLWLFGVHRPAETMGSYQTITSRGTKWYYKAGQPPLKKCFKLSNTFDNMYCICTQYILLQLLSNVTKVVAEFVNSVWWQALWRVHLINKKKLNHKTRADNLWGRKLLRDRSIQQGVQQRVTQDLTKVSGHDCLLLHTTVILKGEDNWEVWYLSNRKKETQYSKLLQIINTIAWNFQWAQVPQSSITVSSIYLLNFEQESFE